MKTPKMFTEEIRSLDPTDSIDRQVISYGEAMTVGLDAEEIHQLRISMVTDLLQPLTKEGHNVLLDLICAIDYLYKNKLREEGEQIGRNDD
jgi:hypothetical protein